MTDKIPQEMDNVTQDSSYRVSAIHEAWYKNTLTFAEALEQLEAFKQEAISSSNKEDEANIYDVLGIMNGYRADYAVAINNFEQARQIYVDIDDAEQVANSDLNLGKAYRLLGNFTRAKACFQRAYDVAVDLDVKNIQAFALVNEGQICFSLKDFTKAQAVLEQALILSETNWDDATDKSKMQVDTISEIYHALVSIHLVKNDLTQAWEHAVKSLESAKESERVVRMGYANRSLGDVITLLKESPNPDYDNNADTYYENAFNAFEEVKAEGEVAKTLLAQGHSLAKRGKNRSAGNKYHQAMVMFTRLGMMDAVAEAAEAQIQII